MDEKHLRYLIYVGQQLHAAKMQLRIALWKAKEAEVWVTDLLVHIYETNYHFAYILTLNSTTVSQITEDLTLR